jgi:biotin operon repressor
MPQPQIKPKLNKIRKSQYRNPILLARQWQKDLIEGKFISQADLSRKVGVSRARVTQVLNLLKLPGEIIEKVCAMGDPLTKPLVTEHSLRHFRKDNI